MDIQTKCVQSGYSPKNGESRLPTICQSTTFAYDTPEEMGDLFDLKASGFFYTRLSNPTLASLEERIASLDGGVAGLACASGMAATTNAVLNVTGCGDNIISLSTIYGGTYNLFNITLRKLGIDTRFIQDTMTDAEIEANIDSKTKIIFAETIANPATTVLDFDRYARICAKYGILFVVDNTLATPIICRPIEHGVNIVVYSTTKYMDGHGAALGGMVIDGGNFDYLGNARYPEFNNPDQSYHGLIYAKDCGKAGFATKIRVQYMRDMGAQMAPFNAYLTYLGIDTLHLRMPKHSDNALALAKFLQTNDNVEWVKYAGLPTDPNYSKVVKYFDKSMASGMIAIGIKGGREACNKFQKALKLFKIATHVADSRSCVLHPASTTHRQLSDQDLIECGISNNLVRLSVGTESAEDIIADIANALSIINN